jgi:hypothetical protein
MAKPKTNMGRPYLGRDVQIHWRVTREERRLLRLRLDEIRDAKETKR